MSDPLFGELQGKLPEPFSKPKSRYAGDQSHQQLGTNSAEGQLHKRMTKSHAVCVRASIQWRSVHSLMR